MKPNDASNPIPNSTKEANQQTRSAWNANASFWDRRMGEGNDFVNVLIRPATERLLDLKPNEHVLDVACGNGLASRRLASLGANVVACDFSEGMIEHARLRTNEFADEFADRIEYRVLDATDEAQLLTLGRNEFDAILCNMGLFDIADIRPLARVLPQLLRRGGRFVFSVIHPCFNNPSATHTAEYSDREGTISTEYGMKVTRYITPLTAKQAAMPGVPEPHLLFHRSLQDLLGTFFQEGWVLDGLEERAFPSDHPTERREVGWNGNYSEIPAVLVGRFRVGNNQ